VESLKTVRRHQLPRLRLAGRLHHLVACRLAPQGIWFAMKGKKPDDEMAAAADVQVFHVEHCRSRPGCRALHRLVAPHWLSALVQWLQLEAALQAAVA
jgi:hypothetical protein